MIRFLTLSLILGLASNLASASPYVEKQISEFVQSSPLSGHKTIQVLVTFKSDIKVQVASGKLSSRLEIAQALRADNMNNIRLLRAKYPWAAQLRIEPLWIMNAVFITMTPRQIEGLLEAHEVQSLMWARKPLRLKKVKASQAETQSNFTYGLKKIGVPVLRERMPMITGAGVRVAVIDTGIDANHPDLRGRLRLFKNFSPAVDDKPSDEFGHGTHVAGTIVGGNKSGIQIGVAPEAQLIVARIFDANGDSDRKMILKAMQWVADPDGNPATEDHAQIVNSSWGDDDPYDDRLPENEPFCQIVQSWVQLNIIPVFSAGNSGPSAGTIGLPAGCPEAFSVGATEQNDRSPHFSSTGPAKWKNLDLVKPEVSAPGFHVKSAGKNGKWEDMSGTSMSSPHVSGAFALLIQAFPSATAEELKAAMEQGSRDLGNPGKDGIFGWGRIDLPGAINILSE